MVAQRANHGDLLAPGFREIYFQRFNSYPDEYTQFFNILGSVRQYEEDSTLAGFGTVPEKDEGSDITYDDPQQGFDVRYTHTTFALGFRVTREMWEDDLYGKMNKMPSALGRSMRIAIENDGANVLNRAFDSNFTGGDGIELSSLVHPNTDGSTQKNELSTPADLSETAIEQAIIDIAATTDDRSLEINLMPRKLIVHPSDQFRAKQLMNSALVPDSGNNAVNTLQGILDIQVSHYVTDTDAWFIQCDNHSLNFFFRRRPDFEPGNDFDTEDAKFKATARWSKGWTDWRGMFCVAGA